jgi:hypothetical protein
MAERAQVTSVDAIEAFRANLIVYLSKARPTLEEAASEVMRTRVWLENEQRNYWEKELRLRKRELERTQAELFSARLSKLQQATGVQEMAFHRAQRAIREAEAKIAVLKKWTRELENQSEPLVKLVDQLHGFVTTDMVKAVAYLAQVVQTLEAYAGIAVPGAAAAAPTSATVEESPGEAEPKGGAQKEKEPSL